MTATIDKFGCLGSSVKTFSGAYFDLNDPQVSAIDLYSIAVPLSRICRFGGHSPLAYSVAEHSVLCVEVARSESASIELCQAVLLHDATEAFIGDVIKPLKMLLPDYDVIESRIENAIGLRFGIDFERYRESAKRIDRMMLKCEKMTFWPSDKNQWQGFADCVPAKVKPACVSAPLARERFVTVARALGLS